jgi:hypothetical protein
MAGMGNKTNFRPRLALCTLVAFVGTIPSSLLAQDPAAKTANAGRKPNVIFILGDDIGWGDLGCYVTVDGSSC